MHEPIDVIKDFTEIAVWIVAIIGGLVTAWLAIAQARANNDQRIAETRRRQAETGKALVDELFDEANSKLALEMLDEPARIKEHAIDRSDIVTALTTKDAPQDPKSVFIRGCFDCLAYGLERMQRFIDSGLITSQDVDFPFSYYATRVDEIKKPLEKYLRDIRYPNALRFLENLDTWRGSP
jgi:hypothetical protein